MPSAKFSPLIQALPAPPTKPPAKPPKKPATVAEVSPPAAPPAARKKWAPTAPPAASALSLIYGQIDFGILERRD